MELLWILLICASIILVVLLISYLCYRMAFYVPNRTKEDYDKEDLPVGEIYEPFIEYIRKCNRETKAIPCEEFCITSVTEIFADM